MRSPIALLVALAACGEPPPPACLSDADCSHPYSCLRQYGYCDEPTPPPDTSSPCGDVPLSGECVTSTVVQRCIVPSGGGTPRVSAFSCDPGEACSVASDGAQCRLTGECRAGDSRCSSSAYQTCVNGRWTTQSCSGTCRATSYGAVCETLPTKSLTLRFEFEVKVPENDYSDWSPSPTRTVTAGLLVSSYASGKLIDSTVTDEYGAFTVKVPTAPLADDYILITAASVDGAQIGMMVARPGFSTAGEYDPGDRTTNARAWSWRIVTRDAAANAIFFASTQSGSAALLTFEIAHYAYFKRKQQLGRSPKPLLIWVDPSVTWSCGSCQWDEPITISGVPFDAQIALAGGVDEGYWSDSVTGHELGHWIMSSYGFPAAEGGTHFLGVPTLPGQAWSEGWATYHQADLLERTWYFSKQQGSMFWLDLAARQYPESVDWQRPVASAGLFQRLDENEVAAMLLQLHDISATAPQSILDALASHRMAGPSFARGYTRHTWSVASDGTITNVIDTGVPAPHFADFLDALNCAGFPRAAIDQATRPTTNYPYPSSSPLCL